MAEDWVNNNPAIDALCAELAHSRLCDGCGKPGGEQKLMACAGCKFAFYHGKECQALHRPAHKRECKALSKIISPDADLCVLDLYNTGGSCDQRIRDMVLARARAHPGEICACDMQMNGETVIVKIACTSSAGSIQLLKELLALMPVCAGRPTAFGLYPIMEAAVNKNVEGVRILHDIYPKGAEKEIWSYKSLHQGGLALHIAIFYAEFNSYAKMKEQHEIVKFLIEKNSDALLVKNFIKATPIDLFLIKNYDQITGRGNNQKYDEAGQLATLLKEETLKLEGGDIVVKEAEANAKVNAEAGLTSAKIEKVMEFASCGHNEATEALNKSSEEMVENGFTLDESYDILNAALEHVRPSNEW